MQGIIIVIKNNCNNAGILFISKFIVKNNPYVEYVAHTYIIYNN